MQRLILIILSSFFLMISCNRSKPKGTLSEKTMVDLMTDVHLVDGYLNTLPVDSTRKVIDGLYDRVFEKYDIDSVKFKANITYYLGNPIVSKDLYAEVTKKLKAYEDDYRRTDSLKNARTTDSIRVVQRYERLKASARRLILDVHVDTIPLTYRVHQRDFMDGAELQAIQLYQPAIPVSHADGTEENSEKDTGDVSHAPTDSENTTSHVTPVYPAVKPVPNPAELRPVITPQRRQPTPMRKPTPKRVEAKPLEN